MTYKELQTQLKTFKSQGFTTISLNAKKDILEAEYNRVMNAMIKDVFAIEPENIETVSALEDTESDIIPTGNEAINEALTITPEKEVIEAMNETNEAMGIVIGINEDSSIEPNQVEISEVSIAESTLSINSESMAMDNEAVTNPPEIEVTSKEFIEALTKLVIIFVTSIVKLWVKVNRISQLTKVLARSRSGAARSIKEARAEIKTFMQWYFSGFKFPEFV